MLKIESANAVLSGTPVCKVLFNAIPPSIASSLAIANGPKAFFTNLPAEAALLVKFVSFILIWISVVIYINDLYEKNSIELDIFCAW